jgi:hypothetical protein
MAGKSRRFAKLHLSLEVGFAEIEAEIGKVSRLFREYSRFAESIGGDGFGQHCRPFSRGFDTEARESPDGPIDQLDTGAH